MNTKSKQKSSADGISKFERAQKLFQDIENIIEQELANTPIIAATYENNIARIKKSKRKRPGLIRNFNTKKNRQVIGGMEFDPETQTWLGNDEVLSAFSPQQPALIANKGKHDKVKVVGKMTWDPKEQKWKGNEKDALKFSPRKPALITPLGSSNYLLKEVSGMVFDVVSRSWIGNDDDPASDVFSQIDTLDDAGFTVGNEFHLSPALTKAFMECSNRHKSTLSGWFTDTTANRGTNLYTIRNMSILRVVRDVKQRRAAYVELDDESDANVPERDVTSPRDANSGNGNNTDTVEDYDDLLFTGSAKLKLPEVGVGADDFGNDFDDEPTPPLSAKGDKPGTGTVQNLGKKVEVEEAWDSDFAEADDDAFKKLKTGSARKPFQELPKRGSVIDLHRERKNSQALKPKVVVEEDEDGLDLPPGPVVLIPSQRALDSDSGLDDVDSSSSSSSRNQTNSDHEKRAETDDFEEEEEDWTDVDVPATFPSVIVMKPHQDLEDWDNDADIEITTNKLTLKRPTRTSDDDDDAERDVLEGVEIPDDFLARLRK